MSRVLDILKAVQTVGRQRACEACGNEFRCGASLSGCWCSEVQLSDETRRELRARYSDCLCGSCLESISNESKGVVK